MCAGLFPDPFCVPYSVVEDEKFSVTSNPCFTDHFFPLLFIFYFFYTLQSSFSDVLNSLELVLYRLFGRLHWLS